MGIVSSWCFRLLMRFLFIMVIASLAVKIHSTNWVPDSPEQAYDLSRVERIHVMIIICLEQDPGIMEEEQKRNLQLVQAVTLLKTVAIFSSRPITVHIAHNNLNIFEQMKNAVSKFEKGDFMRLNSVSIEYPPGLDDMMHAYKICATASLFLHELLPEVDAGIFLDTDVILMGDPAQLWDRFQLFTPFTALALATVDKEYSFKKSNNRHLYYGLPQNGLNSGVVLMNLTRLRALPGGGFTGTIRAIWDEHKESVPYGDQDILNILGWQSPYLFQPLPCEWNFLPIFQCWRLPVTVDEHQHPTSNVFWRKSCPPADQEGIALLHGADRAFRRLGVISAVYKFWTKQEVKSWDAVKGLAELEATVETAVQRRLEERVTHPQSCGHVPGFADMLLLRLRKIANDSFLT